MLGMLFIIFIVVLSNITVFGHATYVRWLFQHILFRQKEQFSDGVGYSWIDGLKEHAEKQVYCIMLYNVLFTGSSMNEFTFLKTHVFPGICNFYGVGS
jgi:hypothetical protein